MIIARFGGSVRRRLAALMHEIDADDRRYEAERVSDGENPRADRETVDCEKQRCERLSVIQQRVHALQLALAPVLANLREHRDE